MRVKGAILSTRNTRTLLPTCACSYSYKQQVCVVTTQSRLRLVLRDVFENVAGLTVEGAAEGFQSRETHRLGLACLKNGKIRGGDTDFLGQFSARHLPASQH